MLRVSSGQCQYLAVDENEPAGKPIALCKKIFVKLTLHNSTLDYLCAGKSFGGKYQLADPRGYPKFRGLMTWSINWDLPQPGVVNIPAALNVAPSQEEAIACGASSSLLGEERGKEGRKRSLTYR
jgi:hypothetical protein